MVALTLPARRRLLLAANALLAAALIWTSYSLVFGHPSVQDTPSSQLRRSRPEALSEDLTRILGPYEQYEDIFQRELRMPLFDPPAVVSAPAPRPQLPVTLEGTAVEPGHSFAFLRTKSGQVELVRQGQSFEGVEVIEVTDRSVTVRFNDETTILTLVDDEGGQR